MANAEAFWLSHDAVSQKVMGSGSNDVNVFINLPNPSGRTMSLVSLSL
jgi:hypothetical protein